MQSLQRQSTAIFVVTSKTLGAVIGLCLVSRRLRNVDFGTTLANRSRLPVEPGACDSHSVDTDTNDKWLQWAGFSMMDSVVVSLAYEPYASFCHCKDGHARGLQMRNHFCPRERRRTIIQISRSLFLIAVSSVPTLDAPRLS